METIWTRGIEMPSFCTLEGRISADACVIGGGLCGLLTAHFLVEAGLDTVLLESGRIACGTSGRTTAKLTAQHGLCYHRLVEKFGQEQAQLYAAANRRAIDDYRALERSLDEDFELRECGTWLYASGDVGVDALERECSAARLCGFDVELSEDTGLPFAKLGLRFGGQATFQPMRVMAALARRLKIFENSRVTEVNGRSVRTENGEVDAKIVVFATRFPFVNFPGFYFMRMHQERDYVLEMRGNHRISECFLGIEEAGVSLRPCSADTLLIGGSSHRAGMEGSGRYEALRAFAAQHFPELREVGCWSAEDCVTVDGVPYIGRFAPTAPDGWLVATGFGKWGMTTSMVAARLVTDIACGRRSEYAELFDPARFKPSAGARMLMEETAMSAKHLARSAFAPPDGFAVELQKGEAAHIEANGRKVGAYRDDDGRLWLVEPRCPHLGCELVWNGDERSWDCPCHGSRFGYDGAQLDGPAQIGIAARGEE